MIKVFSLIFFKIYPHFFHFTWSLEDTPTYCTLLRVRKRRLYLCLYYHINRPLSKSWTLRNMQIDSVAANGRPSVSNRSAPCGRVRRRVRVVAAPRHGPAAKMLASRCVAIRDRARLSDKSEERAIDFVSLNTVKPLSPLKPGGCDRTRGEAAPRIR